MPPPADSLDRRGDSVLTPDVDPTARATPAAPGAPAPDLGQTGAVLAKPETRSAGITVLAVLAVLYTLYFAREFLLPVVIAVLLSFLFSPVVRALARIRVPTPLGGAVVVLALVGALGAGVYELADPVQNFVASAPATAATAQQKVRRLLRPVQQASHTAERVADATTVGGPNRTPEVIVKGPSLVSRVFGTTQRLLAGLLEVVVLLYFLLAAGDLFLQKLVKVLPRRSAKRTAVEVAREIEESVSAYLLTTAAVNVGEGLVVAGVMALLGLPHPLVWGALVALLEFVPYLGAATMVVVLAVAGLTTFDAPGRALGPPAAFLAINLVQANVVAPLALARRLTLNPVAIFVGLAFWFFLWGVPGAFLAVPLLATFKVLCDHVGALAAVGEFLGERDTGERRRMVR